MDKPIKDWGFGIPNYTENDILEGLELHEYCTNIVAQSMQDEGFTIEGIIVNNTPTQVIANKDGKKYFVIVAGDVFPYEGKIPFSMKQRFSEFCLKQDVTPMFASVGLMSSDPERAEARLSLKYDGYYVKYEGNEDLTQLRVPLPDDDDYKSYCVEKIIEAYCTGRFDILYDMFDESIQYHSQWVFEPMIGKKELVHYFDGKGETIRKSNTVLNGSVVVITSDHKKTGNMVLMSEPGKLCALISQKINGKTNWTFISPKFNEENKIVELSLNDPALFNFKPYFAFE